MVKPGHNLCSVDMLHCFYSPVCTEGSEDSTEGQDTTEKHAHSYHAAVS